MGNEQFDVVGLREQLLTVQQMAYVNSKAGDGVLKYRHSKVPHVDSATAVSRYVAQQVHAHLSALKEDELVDEANRILNLLSEPAHTEPLEAGPQQLLSVYPTYMKEPPPAPTTPLSDLALLTNAKGDPQIGSEVRRELASADRVDLICSFVKWSGIRVLESELKDLKLRGVPFRVITTSYMGVTEPKALDFLINQCDAQVRVNYDSSTTRLHAKAWMFFRNTGFDTGYVGSSNLSKAAQLEGLEWNVRVSRNQAGSVLGKFEATFDTYWESPHFEEYVPERDREKLEQALENSSLNRSTVNTTFFDITPHPHQLGILQDLHAERVTNDRHRNLVVAATGTGKTVVAALDYRALAGASEPRLLFVAHREEILRQAMATYRAVLKSTDFGELFVGDETPRRGDHVFASVQSLSRSFNNWPADHFDIVVIDEFHHGAAPTYRKIFDYFKPKELLALTATPERADGINIAQEFFGGRYASEIRLWDALEAQLLVPFHYFGVNDGTDLSRIRFVRGDYDVRQLENVYTSNDSRARIILKELEDKVENSAKMKAIGFCVSVAHAQFMSQRFNAAGLKSAWVATGISREERARAIADLNAGRINCIFTVDMFNEGVDIPSVDTLLMLRPTQSATVFLQQLGRGLRHAVGKSVLTVLDFVGLQNKEFRFDTKLRAMTGLTRKRLLNAVEEGFPFLPPGTQIVFDRVVQKAVLENVKQQIGRTVPQLLAEIQEIAGDRSPLELTMREYMDSSMRPLSAIYGGRASRSYKTIKSSPSWLQLQRWAAGDTANVANSPAVMRAQVLTHVDDPERMSAYLSIADPRGGVPDQNDPYLWMLYYSLWPSGRPGGIDEGIRLIREKGELYTELQQLFDVLRNETRVVPEQLSGQAGSTVLKSHAKYKREEILAAMGMGWKRKQTPGSFVEGVAWMQEHQTEALFVTLNKSSDHFSPETMYKDYALNDSMFHWESQNRTSVESNAGQRYVNQRSNGVSIVLFVRETKDSENGTQAFTCVGNADYISHTGSKPMQVLWKLQRPMPAQLLSVAQAVAS